MSNCSSRRISTLTMASEVEAGREQVGVFVQRVDRHCQTTVLSKDFTDLKMPRGHSEDSSILR